MMLPTFASCQQEKPFPDDAVDKVYEYLPEWQPTKTMYTSLISPETVPRKRQMSFAHPIRKMGNGKNVVK